MASNLHRERFASARVARLATISARSPDRPHLVPVTFALLGPATIVTMVDHKPKRTTALARLENIAARPAVALLADHYEEDWSALWWARADGMARVVEPGSGSVGAASAEAAGLREAAVAALAARYRQYAERPPEGALVVVEVSRWSGWTAA